MQIPVTVTSTGNTTAIQQMEKEILPYKFVEVFNIVDEKTAFRATNGLSAIMSMYNKKNAERKATTAEWRKLTKDVNDKYATGLKTLKKYESILKTKMLRYKAAEYSKLLQQQKKEPTAIIEAPSSTLKTDSGTLSIKKNWKCRLVDITKVKPEYLTHNQAKAEKAMKAGKRYIPGFEIYQEETVAVRTKE